ncbi:dihydroneopterin aldolase [Nitrincola iocasae]|jgi:dihydroneopterin aldolase|uniref:7,8-dihydroneopterin aldolase n=1 Tax=Nitrincola iocasae TaxID=2614693 RepID=A0A5J6LB87_9GAMM|nr:dihydroneopterin aldolase [Nitrincola iocasae]QEW05793.1 dihydroneopterin aldolase [Nitrincola iocasae]
MDIVYIRGLQVETVIGIYDWEREVRQCVCVDLDLGTDIRAAAHADDIDSTLNYKSISDRLIAFISGSEFLLIEALAEEIASLLMDEFSVPWLRLQLGKPGAVPEARDVGIIIERGEKR